MTLHVFVQESWTPLRVTLGFVSPDLDGDLRVDISDVGLFAQDDAASNAGDFRFRADLQPDGVVNLADIGRFAVHLGESCP